MIKLINIFIAICQICLVLLNYDKNMFLLQFFPGIWWLKLKDGNWTRPKYPVLAPSLAKATPVVMAIPQVLVEDNKCAPARAGTVTLYDFRKAGAYFKFLFYRPFRMLHRLAAYRDHFVNNKDRECVYFKISLALCIMNPHHLERLE